MLKNWKTSLLAAGVLATLLAGSAFAATEAEDTAIQQKGLEYNNMIEQQAPDKEKGRPPFHMGKEGQHRPGPRHGGFHKHPGGPHHDGEFRGPHGCKGPQGGPGQHRDGKFRMHHRNDLTRPGRLSKDQRQMLAKEREDFFANWQSMSDRERHEATEKFIHRVNEERMKNMTDTEKKAFEKKQAAKKAEREKIAKMTDDERHDYFKKKHDEMVNARIKNMTKEEKERFLERDKRQQDRMEAFWKKWKQMTPEEKEQWKKEHRRFGPGPNQGAPGPKRELRSDGHGPKDHRPMQLPPNNALTQK